MPYSYMLEQFETFQGHCMLILDPISFPEQTKFGHRIVEETSDIRFRKKSRSQSMPLAVA